MGKSKYVKLITTSGVRFSLQVLLTSTTMTLVQTNVSRSRTRNNSLKSKKSTGNYPTAGQRIKASSHLEEKNKQEETSPFKASTLDQNLFAFPTTVNLNLAVKAFKRCNLEGTVQRRF